MSVFMRRVGDSVDRVFTRFPWVETISGGLVSIGIFLFGLLGLPFVFLLAFWGLFLEEPPEKPERATDWMDEDGGDER